jgi:glutathione peroxidase
MRTILIWSSVIVCVAIAAACAPVIRAMTATPVRPVDKPAAGPDLYTYTFTANDGTPYPLSAHAGKVTLVVNTASKCGFTPQYDGLEALWKTYRERGLIVVAVPTNDFMSQEPGSDAEIQEFCRVRHGVTFPLMRKVTTKGEAADPFYRHLVNDSAQPGAVPWNFEKVLIGRDGRLIARFAPKVAPDDARLTAAIEQALAP